MLYTHIKYRTKKEEQIRRLRAELQGILYEYQYADYVDYYDNIGKNLKEWDNGKEK